MNLGELREITRRILNEMDESGRFDTPVLNLYLNNALYTIADRLDALPDDAEADWPAGQASIQLPLDTLGIRIVRWNGEDLPPTTQEQLDLLDPRWVNKQGRPTRYFTNGPNVIRLVYIPDEDGVVRIRYVRSPARLQQDSDESELPDFLANLAPYYAAYLAKISEVGEEQKATHFLTLFETMLGEAKIRLARRQSVPAGFRIRAEVRR